MPIDCVSRHTIAIFDRGGINKIAELEDVAEVTWGRVRDDISEANVRLTGAPCVAQNETLSNLRSSRHEMVIYRGDDRVWEGPITRLTGTRNTFEIHARDVMHYATRTTQRAAYNNGYPNVGKVIARAKLILTTELARKESLSPPINVLPYLVDHVFPDDAETSANTRAWQYQVWEHIDSLAARGGLDYTVVGRAIHLWDVHRNAMGQTQTVTQNDFLGDITVTEYGMELATWAHVTDGEGRVGSAGANDPYYGEVEILHTAEDEDEGDSPTDAQLVSQAQRNLAGRNPTPIQVRVPDNSTLNPNGVLSISDLVPGVWIPVRAEVIGFNLVQMQKLQSVKVNETPEGETISVTLNPASIDDTPEE